MIERAEFGKRISVIDWLDEARRCSNIVTATRLDRDERCPPKGPHTADPYMMNRAYMSAKRDMNTAADMNRKELRLVWTNPDGVPGHPGLPAPAPEAAQAREA